MRSASDVKDKSIRLENWKYRAQVYYYDGRVVNCGLFDTLVAAQKALLKYPRDVWDGYEKDDYRYKDPDRVRKRKNRTDSLDMARDGLRHILLPMVGARKRA